MSSSFIEWMSQRGFNIIIGGCLLIIVILLIYYYIRSKKGDKQYKKYKEDQSMYYLSKLKDINLPPNGKCPLCQEKVKSDVSYCPHCGKDIRNMELQPIPVNKNVEQPQNTSRTFCNKCGKQLIGQPTFCSNCGNRL